MLGPIWGVAHGVRRSLLTLVPIYGFLELILLGRNGNRWAWETRSWESVDRFHNRQAAWAAFACVFYLVVGLVVVSVTNS